MVELTTKGHMVTLEEEAYSLARDLGLENLSEFVRDAISYFISGTDRELTKSEIRELSKKFAHEKRAALLKQQRISGQTDEEKARVQEYRQKRQDAIDRATRQEVERISPDRFWKYLDDTTGDYIPLQDNIIAAVSASSGHQVDLADVIAAFRRVRS